MNIKENFNMQVLVRIVGMLALPLALAVVLAVPWHASAQTDGTPTASSTPTPSITGIQVRDGNTIVRVSVSNVADGTTIYLRAGIPSVGWNRATTKTVDSTSTHADFRFVDMLRTAVGGTTYDIQASFDSEFVADSTTSIQYTYIDRPGEVTIDSVTSGDSTLTLSWTAPVDRREARRSRHTTWSTSRQWQPPARGLL